MRIAVTGASGFVGQHLVDRLRGGGHEVLRISLRGGAPGVSALAGVRAVVHLAGEPIAQRWTSEVKARMRASRVDGTRALLETIAKMERRPDALVSASAVGYYGSRGDEVLMEDSAPGEGFLPELCVEWERAADRAQELGLRVAKFRMGVVLGRRGGALKKMLLPFRLGLGGPLAGGEQWMSWIHMDDLTRMLEWATGEERVRGAYNAVSPNPVRNEEFTRALGQAVKRPAVLPVPGLALRLLYGEMAEVVAGSQRAVPHAAEAAGFRFQRPDVVEALAGLL